LSTGGLGLVPAGPSPVLAVAHRAGNSLPGLREAVAAGADLVEADVHVRSGRLEVRHLKSLGPLPWLWDRTGTGMLPSTRDRWELVRRTPQLRLEELLDAAQDGATLMLDLKGVGAVGPDVARALHGRSPASEVVVCGRWWPSVDAFARHDWALRVLSARGRTELARLRRRVRTGPPPYGVSVHRSLLTPQVVAELRCHVEVVMTWPVNDETALAAVLDVGVNGVITDETDVLQTVVSAGAIGGGEAADRPE
jgi:glycerophosphoryl diester phosphodiesterase